MEDVPPPAASSTPYLDSALAHVPAWLRRILAWMLSRWPGRILVGSTAAFIKVELFDRSMSIAAQFFTSVFPIVIMLATWLGSGDSNWIGDALDMPDQTQAVLDQAIQGSSQAAFGVVGTIIVLASATSLSRALTRAFAAIWGLPRPKTQLTSAWRWLAVVMTLVLGLIAVHTYASLTDNVPPPGVWYVIGALAFDVSIDVFVPWLLLAGAIPVRRLLPGGLLFGCVMLFVRPATAAWLPRALDSSAERYGSFGVAF